MKNLILFVIIAAVTLFTANAQVPQGFNYQAVARDSKGVILASKSVSLRISILDKSASGGILYSETFSPTTNQFGLFNVTIGNGSVVTGSFSGIDWGTNDKYMKVELDATGGSNYIVMGTTQLLSVPYAMYAGTAPNNLKAGQGIQIKNDSILNLNPDKSVTLTGTGDLKVTGAYPNFSLHADSPLVYSSGTGLTLNGTTFSAQSNAALWNASQLQGNNISAISPSNNQVLKWNANINKWTPQTDTSFSYLAGTGLNLNGNTFEAQNSTALWNANLLQGNALSATAPSSNQLLRWNSSTSAWEPSNEISYSAGTGINISGSTISGAYSAGNGLSLTGSQFAAKNTSAMWNASQLQGNNISATSPTNKQILRWNSTSSDWEPSADSIYWTRRNASTYTTDSIGIGGAPTGGKLDVAGSIRMNDGNQAAGKVMVSDVNGKAKWAYPFNFYALDGYVGSPIASGATAWVMVGPSQTITVTAGQRITYSVQAPLGATGGTASFEYDMVYQNTSSVSNPIVNMVGGSYSIGQAGTIRSSFPATGTYVFTTSGTYKISYGVNNYGTVALNNNDFVNGWFMITDR